MQTLFMYSLILYAFISTHFSRCLMVPDTCRSNLCWLTFTPNLKGKCIYSPIVTLNIVNIDWLVLWSRILILPGVFIQNFHFHTCSSCSFIHLCSSVVCHCINRLSLIYPFSCWWAFRLSWVFFLFFCGFFCYYYFS